MAAKRRVLLPVALVVISVALGGCGKEAGEGPAERAGKSIDRAIDKVGEKIAQATQAAAEKLDRAGDKLKEKTKN